MHRVSTQQHMYTIVSGNRFESQALGHASATRDENIKSIKERGPGPEINCRKPGMRGFVFICGL